MFTHSIRGVECAREVRAAWRALFLFDSEGAGDGAGVVRPSAPFLNVDIRTPLFSADVLKKCALIALHSVAEEGRGGEDGCHTPDLGDAWKLGFPTSPMRESEGEAWSEDGTEACLQVTLEKTMCATMRCMSLGCMGLVARSLSLFLKDWELAKVALSCHMALDMLCQGNA